MVAFACLRVKILCISAALRLVGQSVFFRLDQLVLNKHLTPSQEQPITVYTIYLQTSLKKALLDQDVEYKEAYLSALVEVMTQDVLSITKSQPLVFMLEEGELNECVQLLLEDLEGTRGGPDLLSQTLCALSLLLSPR